ncbi:hypothetical protein B7P43_G09300 [Cryptotermes secundus]|uniref:Helix-turn-helix domain-containing protein n=1 Tax=Cryptotermes secundus TaxID=105785 RepID=A0A2J7Q0G2_9NEOP|nr:hypothetical protein B7P43_G09300 [Cryptotermes secundus]
MLIVLVGHLPFLDIDIYRRPDGSIGHTVYRKPTYTNLYLNAKSHHHPSSKQAALSTLVHRARALCDQGSLHAELEFLKDIFRRNGYNDRQIHRALNRHPNSNQPDDRRETVAFLPFVGTIFNRISRVLSRHNIKSVGLPKEHQRHNRLEHPDKSAVAEHRIDLGHRIQLQNTSILATKTRYMDRIIREAIEIELHHDNMNREGGFVSANHGSLSSVP